MSGREDQGRATRLSGDDWGYILLGFLVFPLVIGLLVFAEMSL